MLRNKLLKLLRMLNGAGKQSDQEENEGKSIDYLMDYGMTIMPEEEKQDDKE